MNLFYHRYSFFANAAESYTLALTHSGCIVYCGSGVDDIDAFFFVGNVNFKGYNTRLSYIQIKGG